MWAHAVFPDAVAQLGLKLGSLRTSLHVDCQKQKNRSSITPQPTWLQAADHFSI